MHYDVQASRTTSVVNFSITLDSEGEMPSAFESSAAAAAFFGELSPSEGTPFADAVADPMSTVEMADADADTESRERVASAFEAVFAAIAQSTGDAAGPG